MSAVTVTFLGIGALSLLLLVLSLVGGHLGHLGLDHGHAGQPSTGADGDGFILSLPVLTGFLGGFGFGGAIAAELVPGHHAWAAAAGGLVAAVPAAWLAGRLLRAAVTMPTDATPTSADLIGTTGVIISAVPDGGYGEVRLTVAGQPVKFNARSAAPLPPGTHVFVIDVPSPSSVMVEPTAHFP
jgi:membrane protein implicated in regulation of membrane protease activity